MSNVTAQTTPIKGVIAITPRLLSDERGWFAEIWNARSLAALGIEASFVQENASSSLRRGTIRGLHFQKAPAAQAKLVRVVRGAIFDVAVDLRRGSATFGRHVGEVLSATNFRQLFIPAGFAHGYCTLEDDTEVAYKASAFYSPQDEGGVVWNDPDLAIAWPLDGREPTLSAKDGRLPRLTDLGYAFD